MADRDRSITELFLHHELGHGLAHDVRTSEDDTLLSAGLDVVTFQQGDDAKRCRRDKTRQADGHTANIDGMETVNVLTVVNGLNNLLFINMFGQGELHNKAIDITIAIQIVDTGQKFFFRHVILETDERRLEATGLTSQYLIFYVGLRTAVVPHQYSGQMGLLTTTGDDLLYLFSNLGLDSRSRCFSVNEEPTPSPSRREWSLITLSIDFYLIITLVHFNSHSLWGGG